MKRGKIGPIFTPFIHYSVTETLCSVVPYFYCRDGATSSFAIVWFIGCYKIWCGLVAKKSSEIHTWNKIYLIINALQRGPWHRPDWWKHVNTAIRSGPYDDPDNLGMRQCFQIQFPKSCNRGVSIWIWLEIGQIMFRVAVPHTMKLDTLVYLHWQWLSDGAVRWMEGGIVAKWATSVADGSVPVRACESGVYHEFLESFAVQAFVIADKCIISFFVRETGQCGSVFVHKTIHLEFHVSGPEIVGSAGYKSIKKYVS